MMAHPDQREQTTGHIPGVNPNLPDVGEGFGENVIPALPVDLTLVAGEAERRAVLLSAVTVDERGIAHSANKLSAVETHLAVVLLDAQKPAILARLEVVDEQTVGLVLPEIKPQRIGFFLGHTSRSAISGAFRMGLYPGQPLITGALTDERNEEVYLNVANIKSDETEEHAAAVALDLYGVLGFTRGKTRGVFHRFHRPNRTSNTWRNWDLVIFPDKQIDTVKHFSASQVRNNTFQTLFYTTQEQQYRTDRIESPFITTIGRSSHLGNQYLEAAPQMYSKDVPTKEIMGAQVGFGRESTSQAQTRGIKITELQGAFQVVVGYQE